MKSSADVKEGFQEDGFSSNARFRLISVAEANALTNKQFEWVGNIDGRVALIIENGDLYDGGWSIRSKHLDFDGYGIYYNATDSKFPADFATQPFAFVEKGGRVAFPYGENVGKQPVVINLGAKSGKGLELVAEVDFPDNRSFFQKFIDFCKFNLIELIIGITLFIALAVSGFLFLRHRKRSRPVRVVYAHLDEIDGMDTRHELTKTASTIGRSSDNDIQLRNDSISAHHAEIHRRREGDFYIVDLASSNGVYVNGSRVNQIEIHDGDLIELGDVRLHFYTT
jgi:hypothetical protein